MSAKILVKDFYLLQPAPAQPFATLTTKRIGKIAEHTEPLRTAILDDRFFTRPPPSS
jgi:hypothetical protein